MRGCLPDAQAEPGLAGRRMSNWRLLPILLAAVMAASFGPVRRGGTDLAHSLSVELGGPGAKALRPHAGVIWRSPGSLRKEGGRAQPKAADRAEPPEGIAAPTGRDAPRLLPRSSQSFLTCRTWNPRDPPRTHG
jgi:hypothetical protein